MKKTLERLLASIGIVAILFSTSVHYARATTTTFFSSVSGDMYRDNGGVPSYETWAVIRAGAGTLSQDTGDTIHMVGSVQGFPTIDSWDNNQRSIAVFDTSAIGAGATVTAATISFCSYNKINNTFDSDSSLDVYVSSSTPASNTTLQNSDYLQTGVTSFGSIAYGSIVTDSSTYNNITLNAAGLANINVTGSSKFGFRAFADLSATQSAHTISPTQGQGSFVGWIIQDHTGTSCDPKLSVTYTTGGGNTFNFWQFFAW